MYSSNIFQISAGMWSGPAAFLVFILRSTCLSSVGVKGERLNAVGVCRGSRGGGGRVGGAQCEPERYCAIVSACCSMGTVTPVGLSTNVASLVLFS